MSSPLAIYKLIILYLLDKADGEIAMDRLSSFLLEKGYVNFLSLTQTYAEIEKSGLVRSRNSGRISAGRSLSRQTTSLKVKERPCAASSR